MKEAMLYEKLPNDRVQCYLCAHRCLIADEKGGVCQVWQNQAGTLYTLVYGTVIARHLDSVEKKPFNTSLRRKQGHEKYQTVRGSRTVPAL